MDLSEAGARLADYRPTDPTTLADVYRGRDRRRRRRRVGVGAAGMALAAVCCALVIAFALPSSQRAQHVATNSPGGSLPTATTSSATAEQLAAGHWSVLPPAPIPTRDDPVVVWTGQEIIVWGGHSGSHDGVVDADGAAYDPSTGKWRVLPAAPITGRVGPAAVWTGSEVLIWGGYDIGAPPFRVAATGAAYDPNTNSWRTLPPSPLSARANMQAVWTGDAMLILGGSPAVMTYYDTDGALYNATSNTWQAVSAVPKPAGHGIDWVLTTQFGDDLLAWSTWSVTTPNGPGSTSISAGVDFYSYNEQSATWQTLGPQPAPVPDPLQAIPAGHDVVVRGVSYYCGPCTGPPPAEVSAFYDPATNSWTPIASDPIGIVRPQSAWTGDAIVSVGLAAESSSPSQSTSPGDGTAYDPKQQKWYQLPPPPSACQGYASPIWTGRELITICISTGDTAPSFAGGIALTPAA